MPADQRPAGVEYRDVPGYLGYQVGDDGSVWSCKENHGAVYTIGTSWRRLKTPGPKGHYQHVILCQNGDQESWAVHRLVLTVFVGPANGREGRHLDGDKYNNRLSNLCWGTRRENMADMVRHGRSTRGERNGQAKLTIENVRTIRVLSAAGWNTARIARHVGECYWTVRNVVTGHRWRDVA